MMRHSLTKTMGVLLATTAAISCVGQSPAGAGACAAASDCQPGSVCVAAVCEELCGVNGDCASDEVCVSQLCVQRVAGPMPSIASVTGNGTLPDRFYDQILVEGSELDQAQFRLESAEGGATPLTAVGSRSNTLVTLQLNDAVAAGAYTLTATNESGTGDARISLLAEPRTASELRDLLMTVDGEGSGIDADSVDGREAAELMLPDCGGANGGVPIWNDGAKQWTCAASEGFADGDTLASLGGCNAGDVAKLDETGTWSCRADLTLEGVDANRRWMVGASAFGPQSTALGYTGNATGTWRSPAGSGTTLLAPVNLPQDAVVTGLRCRLDDRSTVYAATVALTQTHPGTSVVRMAEVTTGPDETKAPATTDPHTSAITEATINNGRYFYTLLFESKNDVGGGGCGDKCRVSYCWISYNVSSPYP